MIVSSAPTSPMALIGGPPCCTWVIILDAPPAADMMYRNEKRGLSPSEYAGGGSASSSLLLFSALESVGSAFFVSATVLAAAWSGSQGGVYAGAADDASPSVPTAAVGGDGALTNLGWRWSGGYAADADEGWGGVKSDENGGGRWEGGASETGYCGGGDCSRALVLTATSEFDSWASASSASKSESESESTGSRR